MMRLGQATSRMNIRPFFFDLKSKSRFNHNFVVENTIIVKPTSTALQFTKLFVGLAVGTKIYSVVGFNTGVVTLSTESITNRILTNVGDVVSFGLFSLLSAQQTLNSTKNNVIQDALVARPKDIKQICQLVGGRIGVRATFYFVVCRECLMTYSSIKHMPEELVGPMVGISLLVSIPVAGFSSVVTWFYGRMVGYSMVGNNHSKAILSLEKAGVEPHLIGPRYSFQALKSHPIDRYFLKNRYMAKVGCLCLAVVALTPHLYSIAGDIEPLGTLKRHGDGIKHYEWSYRWSTNGKKGSISSSDDFDKGSSIDGVAGEPNDGITNLPVLPGTADQSSSEDGNGNGGRYDV
jgi:hypothetical protein